MPTLEEMYPDKVTVEKAFPIADMWVELKRIVNTESLDDPGYTKTTKVALLDTIDLKMKEANTPPIPRYDCFEEIRKETNLEMYNPLGRSSTLLRAWNSAANYILKMYGFGPK